MDLGVSGCPPSLAGTEAGKPRKTPLSQPIWIGLNPNGEPLLGVELEDKYALENAEANAKVPGIGFAEW